MSQKIHAILILILSSFTLITLVAQNAYAEINPLTERQQSPTPNKKLPSVKPDNVRQNISPFPDYCKYSDPKMVISPGINPEKIAPGMVIHLGIPIEKIAPGMIIPCRLSPNFKK